MVQTLPRTMTFSEFLEWHPEEKSFELIDGIALEMQPTGKHERIIDFVARKLDRETEKLEMPFFFPRQLLIKPPASETGYRPDIAVVDLSFLESEPLWEKAATITKGPSVPLVVEVVSTNWENDYARKLEDYETMGISEYWIIDYLALGGRRYIGFPKQPTISIYCLLNGSYQLQQFRGTDQIESITFPSLNLTAEQIFSAG